MSEYTLEFDSDWPKYFDRQDKSNQVIIKKKLIKLKSRLEGRHLKLGLDFFVLEFGQYRLAYKKDESKKNKTL